MLATMVRRVRLFRHTGIFFHPFFFFIVGIRDWVTFDYALFLVSAIRQGLRPLASANCGWVSHGGGHGARSASRGACPDFMPCARRLFRRLPLGTRFHGRQCSRGCPHCEISRGRRGWVLLSAPRDLNDVFAPSGLRPGLQCPFNTRWLSPNNQLLRWVRLWRLETGANFPPAR